MESLTQLPMNLLKDVNIAPPHHYFWFECFRFVSCESFRDLKMKILHHNLNEFSGNYYYD